MARADHLREVLLGAPRHFGLHPGGVVVSFCDGHLFFLSEDIDYQVYQHLMTPDSAKAGVPGKLDERGY